MHGNGTHSRPAWRRAGHHTTTRKRSSRLFPQRCEEGCSIRRATRQRDVSPSGSSRLATMWWLTDWRQADHYVTSRMRSSRLFPRRVLHSAGDPTEGRNRNNVRSGAHTLLSSPDLCKSGAERAENITISIPSAHHHMHTGLNGVTVYSKRHGALTGN